MQGLVLWPDYGIAPDVPFTCDMMNVKCLCRCPRYVRFFKGLNRNNVIYRKQLEPMSIA